MRVLITGGAGFIGQRLIAALLARGTLDTGAGAQPIESIDCVDTAAGAIREPRVRNHAIDIADSARLGALVDERTTAVFHLAAVVSGTAESDFALGMRVNLDGTRGLLDACRVAGARPRLLFASSIAVFGGELPALVRDDTVATPQGSYGTQKLIGELLVQDYTRKGFVDGRSVRLPTVVVRPGRPNGAASSFASAIVREPLAGIDAVLPVDPATVMWVVAPGTVVTMLLHAIELPAGAWGWQRSLNLPGLAVAMNEVLASLERVGGAAARARVHLRPDPAIERLVGSWAARFDCRRAREMGFRADPDFDAIVAAYVRENPDAAREARVPGGA